MEQKFNSLRIISKIFKVIAWIVAVFAVIGFFTMIAIGSASRGMAGPFAALGGVGGAFITLLYGSIMFIFIYTWAEVIMVLLAIEESTRRSCEKLTKET